MKTLGTSTIGLLNALGTTVYVFLISQILQNAEHIFGKMNKSLAPLAFLLMFVLSAAITGGLVLGRPLLWYLDGKKTEAVKLFLATIAWLAIITLIIFAILLIR